MRELASKDGGGVKVHACTKKRPHRRTGNKPTGRPRSGDTISEIAKTAKVSRRLAAQAVKVSREAPELMPAIMAGTLTLGKAIKQLKTTESQREIRAIIVAEAMLKEKQLSELVGKNGAGVKTYKKVLTQSKRGRLGEGRGQNRPKLT